MKKMKPVVVLLLLVGVAWGLSLPEDDLVFDDVVEEKPTSSVRPDTTKASQHKAKKWQRVEKLLGLPDAVAAVGHVFKLHVPKQAFSGSIDYYKVQGINGKSLAHWLRWDEPASALYGVPSKKDVGRTRITIKAIGTQGDSAEDSFTVHVVPERREHVKYNDDKKRCSDEQDRIMLSLLADTKYESLRPRDKVNALENLAGFFGLPTNAISIQPEIGNQPNSGGDVILSGPGNVGRRQEKHSTIVQWQIGCNGHFWPRQMDMVKQLSEQARDGTLSEVTQLRVYHWRVRSEPTDYARNRREISGSGDDFTTDAEEDEDYEEEGEDEYDDYDSTESAPRPTANRPAGPAGPGLDEHPHRHHHGEDSIAEIGAGGEDGDFDTEDDIWTNRDRMGLSGTFNTLNSTTSTSTATPSTTTTETPASPSTTTETRTTTTTTTSPSSEPSTTTSTTTTTTEPPTSPSTSESTPATDVSSESEEEWSSSESSSTSTSTTTTTTETTYNATVDASSEPTTTTNTTFTNLTQIVTTSSTGNATAGNVTVDSMTTDVDENEEEEPLTTDQDFDNETDNEIDDTSTVQPIVYSESSSTPAGNVSEPSQPATSTTTTTTAEPATNATSIFSVNSTTEEYPEGYPGPSSSASSTTSYTWSDNATDKGESLDPYDSMHVSVVTESSSTSTTTQSTTASSTTESTTTSTTEPPTSPTTESTTPSTTTTTTTPSTTTSTTPEPTTSTSTTTARFNNRPEVRRRLKKIVVTQGKPLSYRIPEDTFDDLEDGDTKQLRLRVTESGAPLKTNNWLQFNEETQEIYGLPLHEHYGTYTFEVEARDREGETVSSKFDVQVQQHKQSRAVNHEFTVYLRLKKRSAFTTDVDWELKVMRDLASLYDDSDLSHITVRSVEITGDQAMYTWTNDSLVRSSTCPQDDIKNLLLVLVKEEKSEVPSLALENTLAPEIKVERIVYQGFEQCRDIKEIEGKKTNFNPIPRNQIDQLNATSGQLFVFRVPKDTFFDEEDGDTSSMRASLLFANRSEIPPWNWLQFDSSNQEFYGVPLDQDVGSNTYQLIVKDKEGLEATDSLVAQVHRSQDMRHVLEFKMVLSSPYESFVSSAQKKRAFIQKLQKLYGDMNPSAISILSVLPANGGGTAVIWRNLTLPTDRCPTEELVRLRGVLIDEEKRFTYELNDEFNNDHQNPDFAIIQITPTPTGACYDVKAKGVPEVPTVDDTATVGARYDEYLITFVLPVVIIAAMVMLASLIACILYKKRRSGKMSISEKDDERQSFRSKGIPVIFQDELEEKPDPGNKSPIILKEEKPPLPPPEYQRAEDGADIPMLSKEGAEEPYQPPPPFATARDSNQRNRPKPTPTYRKPPPYVPP